MQKDTLPHPWFVCRPAVAEKFYRADSASWASVEGALDQPNTRLRPGNQLLTHARTGKATEEVVGLTSKEDKEGSAQVYSLTVGGLHCYFASGVLVKKCMHTVVDGGSNVWTCCWIRKPRGWLGI